jgi:hypothetical protein
MCARYWRNHRLSQIIYGRKRPYPRSTSLNPILKLQDLGKIRYAWYYDPRISIADPAKLFELPEENGLYGSPFGLGRNDILQSAGKNGYCPRQRIRMSVVRCAHSARWILLSSSVVTRPNGASNAVCQAAALAERCEV